ncbi:hypothetical protein FGM00_04840 [Aggregatimonas sangjinii]|uniref:Alginate export domain-containing protein n=1 Tax=Aggregatimonas sangjinii TaxID=2583587 RepID=A0A5B7SR67_9FLAO|nr:alginate export family protein [Aggregatimonas sangjinii]QCW99467.1 hypothetical protein FGM00_04840 [Aggregatimonas sangjinii]
MSKFEKCILLLILISLWFSKTQAQEIADVRPPILPIRYLENYGFLKDSSKATAPFDTIKFIRLNAEGSSYVSFGGELRSFYESIHNRQDEGEGFLLTRLMAHADLHLGNRFRFFVQPASGFELFKETPARVIDRDELFLLNLFADYKFIDTGSESLTARLGRQELNYGRGRMVTIREGPNVRHYWEGIKLIYETSRWKVDGFLTKYGNNQPGVLDNPILDSEETFLGVYAQSNTAEILDSNIDLHYFGFIDEISQFFNAEGEETRHSLGLRLYNIKGKWDYDVEAIGQFGTVGESNIAAFGFYGETGYTFYPKASITKRIGLKVDYFTGDRDSTDTKLNSFNPMYPRQGYYRGAGALYASNFWDIHPSFTIAKENDFNLLVDWAWYWRTSVEDGLYIGGNGMPLLEPDGLEKEFLGSQLNFQLTYTFNPYMSSTINYSRFYSGGFVRDNPTPMEISDFLNLTFLFRF